MRHLGHTAPGGAARSFSPLQRRTLVLVGHSADFSLSLLLLSLSLLFSRALLCCLVFFPCGTLVCLFLSPVFASALSPLLSCLIAARNLQCLHVLSRRRTCLAAPSVSPSYEVQMFSFKSLLHDRARV